MNYKYSSINPTENKQLYMYSNYHGIEFVKAYKQNRKTTLKICLQILTNTYDKKDNIFEAFSSDTFEKCEQEDIQKLFIKLLKNKLNLLKQNYIELNNEIINNINFILNDYIENKILEKQKINSLVKIFEVKKSFSKDLEKLSIENNLNKELDEICHLAFSYIIFEYFKVVKSFKYLSTLFKINDLLIYRLNNQKFLNIDLLACSIGLELIVFNKTEKDILGN